MQRRTVYTRRLSAQGLGGRAYVEDFFPVQARRTFCWVGTAVLRRDLFDEVGLFDTTMRFAEDMDMWFRIALRYPQVGYCRELAAIWWAREGSLSAVNPKTPDVMLGFAERYGRLAAQAGPEAVRRCRPLVARWLATAAWVGLMNGRDDVLRTIAGQYGDWISPELRWLCRLLPRTAVRSVAAVKNTLKGLRPRL